MNKGNRAALSLPQTSARAHVHPLGRAIARRPSRTMSNCTSGDISSRIASNGSRSFVASLRATTRPTPASPQPFTSSPPSSLFDECLQSLMHRKKPPSEWAGARLRTPWGVMGGTESADSNNRMWNFNRGSQPASERLPGHGHRIAWRCPIGARPVPPHLGQTGGRLISGDATEFKTTITPVPRQAAHLSSSALCFGFLACMRLTSGLAVVSG
jgi:hypothetical protein